MRKLIFTGIAFIFALNVFQACNEPISEQPGVDEFTLKSGGDLKSYIVVLNDAELNAELELQSGYEAKQKIAKSAADKILKRASILDSELGFVYGFAIKGFSVKMPFGQLQKLLNDASVDYIEEDQIITLDLPDLKQTTSLGNVTLNGQTYPWGITRVNGGANYSGARVAWIIDTGIDLLHPDLNVQSSGKSFVTGVISPNDDNGHGTHCAGIVAAIDNTIGVIGVAAGATVVPVKVLNSSGSGSYSAIIAGVDYVATNGKSGDVANMSLGGPKYTPLNEAVIKAAGKGIRFTLAAGNERTKASTKSPASAEGVNIFTVSAMGEGDIWASYSNYGNPPVDYCEPGSLVYSCYKNGGYATMSGTSMSAPHLAGILLLDVIKTDGYVNKDRDKMPDPIGIH